MEIYPDCELYEDFDYSKCNGCDRCKQWQKFPDCDTCPAKNYCDGVWAAKEPYDTELVCNYSSNK